MESLARPRQTLSCGSCGAAFTRDGWFALPVAQTLTHATITHHVVRWPASQTIEVRQCSRCGRGIARKA